MTDYRQHPTIQMAKMMKNFVFLSDKPLKVDMDTAEAGDTFAVIEKKLKRFDAVAADIQESYGKEEDAITKEAKEDFRLEIVHSAIDENFRRIYKNELRTMRTAKSLFEFLKNSFDHLTKEEKANAAEKELESMVRLMERNERFVSFYNRLQCTAALVDDNEYVRNHLIKKVFKANLTPRLQEFLVIQGKQNVSVSDMAKFLDEKLQYKNRLTVSSVESGRMEKDLSILKTEIKALTENMTLLMQTVSKQHDDETGIINQIEHHKNGRKVHTKRRENTPNFRQKMQNQQFQWELNKYGKPIKCQKCGLMGHSSSSCLGLCKQRCYSCKEVGHLQSVCRKNKNTTKNF